MLQLNVHNWDCFVINGEGSGVEVFPKHLNEMALSPRNSYYSSTPRSPHTSHTDLQTVLGAFLPLSHLRAFAWLFSLAQIFLLRLFTGLNPSTLLARYLIREAFFLPHL